MIFDSHIHICTEKSLENVDRSGPIIALKFLKANPYEDYMVHAKSRGITKAVAFPMVIEGLSEKDTDLYVLGAARKHPDFFIPCGVLTPNVMKLALLGNYMVGFKDHFAINGKEMNKALMDGYDFMQQNDLVLNMHSSTSIRASRPEFVAQNFPKLQIIVAHGGRKTPWTGEGVIEEVIPALAKYENVVFDTSTIRCPETVTKMVEMIGDERIMFGSDLPFGFDGEDTYQIELGTVLNARIPEASKAKLLCGNMSRVMLERWERKKQNLNAPALQKVIAAGLEQKANERGTKN